MSRAIFLTLYIPVALFFSGGFASMWTVTLMALSFGKKGAAAMLSPVFLIACLAPIALIVLAYARGSRINNRKLIWLPIAAFILTLTPLLLILLANVLPGQEKSRFGSSASVYVSMILAWISTAGPLILHTICCVLGSRNDSPVKREDPSIRRDGGYDNVVPRTSLSDSSPSLSGS